MLKQYLLNEDKLPQKLPVVYSDSITRQIEEISDYNRGNTNGLSALNEYVNWISNHVSIYSIAFGYGNNYRRNPNGITTLYDRGVSFSIIDDCERTFVYIIWINLNFEELGLETPPMLYENVQNNGSVKKIQSLIERIENL